MTTDDKIRDEKLQYNINGEATKISALSSEKIDKYKYFIGEEILLSNRRQIIEQARLIYCPLGKALQKQTEKLVNALKYLDFSNEMSELNQLISIYPQN